MTPTPAEAFILYLEETLPELVAPKDLLKVGLAFSPNTLSLDRKNGNCPDYICMGPRRIRYLKGSVIEYVRQKIKRGKVEKDACMFTSTNIWR